MYAHAKRLRWLSSTLGGETFVYLLTSRNIMFWVKLSVFQRSHTKVKIFAHILMIIFWWWWSNFYGLKKYYILLNYNVFPMSQFLILEPMIWEFFSRSRMWNLISVYTHNRSNITLVSSFKKTWHLYTYRVFQWKVNTPEIYLYILQECQLFTETHCIYVYKNI